MKMEDECDADDPRERREYLQREKIVRLGKKKDSTAIWPY